jgi:predicted nucleotidyltransferase
VAPHEVLLDSPPIEREVEFDVDIYYAKERRYRSLGDVSPVVRALAKEQFDDYVKRVRVFAHPRVAADLRDNPRLTEILGEAISRADS